MYFDRRSRRAYRRGGRGMRGGRGIFGFPWFLFILIIIFSHSFWGILFAIAAAVILTAVLMRLFGSQGMMGGNYQQPPQQPYYQPPQQPYQPPISMGAYACHSSHTLHTGTCPSLSFSNSDSNFMIMKDLVRLEVLNPSRSWTYPCYA